MNQCLLRGDKSVAMQSTIADCDFLIQGFPVIEGANCLVLSPEQICKIWIDTLCTLCFCCSHTSPGLPDWCPDMNMTYEIIQYIFHTNSVCAYLFYSYFFRIDMHCAIKSCFPTSNFIIFKLIFCTCRLLKHVKMLS